MDAISSLPNDVLGKILSLLPTRQAASTSVLSKRWRNVFLLVSNLDFDYRDSMREGRLYYKPEYTRKFIEFVENLINPQGDLLIINKLSLKYHLSFDQIHLQSWINTVLERGASDLDLDMFIFPYESWKYQPVPSFILKSKTLVKLKLGRYFTVKLSEDDYLPMLKSLCLASVDFSGDPNVLETLIPRCPVLEELVVEDYRHRSPGTCSVSSPSLKRLCLRRLDSIRARAILFDFPNLVYFEISFAFVSILSKLKLDSLVEARFDSFLCYPLHEELSKFSNVMSFVNAIRNVTVLHLCQSVLELFSRYSHELPLGFDNLVYLSIESVEKRGWAILPLMIKNSPNLETVIFKGLSPRGNYEDEYYCYDSEESLSSSLSSSRVKVLEISGYHEGTARELSQMKHFLEKLPCLELVKIYVDGNDWDYFEVIMDMVPRASQRCNRKVQVIFEPTQDKRM